MLKAKIVIFEKKRGKKNTFELTLKAFESVSRPNPERIDVGYVPPAMKNDYNKSHNETC